LTPPWHISKETRRRNYSALLKNVIVDEDGPEQYLFPQAVMT